MFEELVFDEAGGAGGGSVEVGFGQDIADPERDFEVETMAELKEFVAIPSISTLVEHKPDMLRAAGWVAILMADKSFKD